MGVNLFIMTGHRARPECCLPHTAPGRGTGGYLVINSFEQVQ